MYNEGKMSRSGSKLPPADCKMSVPFDDFFADELLKHGFFSLSDRCEADRQVRESPEMSQATFAFHPKDKRVTPAEKIKEFYMRFNTGSLENMGKLYAEIESFGKVMQFTKEDQESFKKLSEYIKKKNIGFNLTGSQKESHRPVVTK